MNNILLSLDYFVKNDPDLELFTYLDGNKNKKTLSYRKLDERARLVAAQLIKLGQPQDRVILIYPPGLEFIIAFIACVYAGKIAIPVMPPVSYEAGKKLEMIFEDAKPIVCLTDKSTYHHVRSLKLFNKVNKYPLINKLVNKFVTDKFNFTKTLFDSNLFKIDWLLTDEMITKKNEFISIPEINPKDPIFLQYTSGSTGNPKGVVVTHGALIHNIDSFKYCLQLKPEDILYSWLPQYHDMGLIGCILCPIHVGLKTIISSPLNFLTDPISWLQAMSDYKCTISAAPNFAYELCSRKISKQQKKKLDLSSWRVAVNSAEPIRASTLNNFYNCFKECGFNYSAFYPSYGLAEATLFVTTKSVSPVLKYKSLDKFALQNNQLKWIDEGHKDSFILIGSGDIDKNISNHQIHIANPETGALIDEGIGEIWVSSSSVNPGYWGKADLIPEIFHVFSDKGEGPYLRTGDLGFISEEQLYVTGRMKDLIILRGKNYYPQDIEHCIEQSHQAVRAGCINAFSIDHEGEESLIVIVELRAKKTSEVYQQITANILEMLQLQLNLVPDTILLVQAKTLKKTSSGKVRRQLMKAVYLDNDLHPYFVWTRNNMELNNASERHPTPLETGVRHFIIELIKENAPHQNRGFNPEYTFSELGYDSLSAGDLVAKLNQYIPPGHHNINLSILIESKTINAFIDTLEHDFVLNPEIKTTPSVKSYSEEEQKKFLDRNNLPEYVLFKKSRETIEAVGAEQLFFNIVEGIADNLIQIDHKSYINYANYNYLGYSGDKRVIAATQKAIAKYGTSVSASRVVSGQKSITIRLEEELAALIGVESALVFSAGHATNVSVISHLYNHEDVIFHDSLIHNSCLQGATFAKAKRISFPHNNVQALETLMQEYRHHYRRALILIEGVYSMDGDIADVPQFIELKNKYFSHIMVDEAHSMGVIGKTGKGIREYFNLSPQDIDIWMGTLSKAFASCGGYVAGSRELIDYLKFTCGGFVYSAGISPANVAAALESIRLLNEEPIRPQSLQHQSARLLAHLNDLGIYTGTSKNTPIIPIIIGDSQETLSLSLQLKDYGIYALPIVFPAVEHNAARIRLFINCMHTDDQLDYTAETVSSLLQKKQTFS